MSSNNFIELFRFKQFLVYQDLAAMKVGTDGVLLGAWSNVSTAKRILDVGTGTGLISLMAAQRNFEAKIDAIEIDKDAYQQAQYNFEISPWKNRLQIILSALQNYQSEQKYDAIISNPPFFEVNDKMFDDNRKQARQTQMLSLEDLVKYSSKLLEKNGIISYILPAHKEEDAKRLAMKYKLFPTRITYVKGHKNAKIKRILISMTNMPAEQILQDELIIEIVRHKYTDAYKKLTQDFYLNM